MIDEAAVVEAVEAEIDKPMDKTKVKLVKKGKIVRLRQQARRKTPLLRSKMTAEKIPVKVAKVAEDAMMLKTVMIIVKPSLLLECPYSISSAIKSPVEVLRHRRKKGPRSHTMIEMIATIATIGMIGIIGIQKETIAPIRTDLRMIIMTEGVTEMIVVNEMKGTIAASGITLAEMIGTIVVAIETVAVVIETIGIMTEVVATIEMIEMIVAIVVIAEIAIMADKKGPMIEAVIEMRGETVILTNLSQQNKTKAAEVVIAKTNLPDSNKNKLNSIKSMALKFVIMPAVIMVVLEVIGATEVRAAAKKAGQAIVISVNGVTALMLNPSSEIIMADMVITGEVIITTIQVIRVHFEIFMQICI